MNSNNSSMIYKRVKTPTTTARSSAPERGQLFTKLSKSDFADRINKFKLLTLYVKEEVCTTMVEIKRVCDYIAYDPEVCIYK
jgi:hypothetical protein